MLENMVEKNEKILWQGKPNKICYLLGKPSYYLAVCIFYLFSYFCFKNFFTFQENANYFFEKNTYINKNFPSMFSEITNMFFLIKFLPIVVLFLFLVYRFFNYYKLEYIVTNKNVYISSGILNSKTTIIENKTLKKLEIKTNIIEKMFNTSTIQLTPNIYLYNSFENNRRTIQGHALISIKNPEEVYKIIKGNLEN